MRFGVSRFYGAVFGILGSLTVLHGASGASFSCAQASAQTEQVICSDKVLSALDSEMAADYRAALARLSAEGANLVTAGQREWVGLARRSCQSNDVFGSHTLHDRALCLAKSYRGRIEQLKTSAIQAGPFLFSRVDRFRTAMGTDIPAGPRLATDQRSYPRIDQPNDARTMELNRILHRTDMIPECGVHADGTGDGDGVDNYELTFASERLISVTWQYWFYCFGAAHGQGGSLVQTLVLDSRIRELRSTDLFRGNSGWQERLAELSAVAVKSELDKKGIDGKADDLSSETLTAIRQIVENTRSWTIRAQGLEVAFGPYMLAMGYPATATIMIPWMKLRLVMRSDAPIW